MTLELRVQHQLQHLASPPEISGEDIYSISLLIYTPTEFTPRPVCVINEYKTRQSQSRSHVCYFTEMMNK